MMIPQDESLTIISEFGHSCNYVFLSFFLFVHVPFHQVFVAASEITLIPHMSFFFYCSHFEWPETADVSSPP